MLMLHPTSPKLCMISLHIVSCLSLRWSKELCTKFIWTDLGPNHRGHWDVLAKIVWKWSFGRPYYRSRLWLNVSSVCRLSSVCDVLYCGETVRPSEKVSEGANRKPGSKSWFFGSPSYLYFRFHRYSHRDGRFCLIFARTAQWLVLDGTNGPSSS